MSSSAALDQLDTLDDRLDALLPFLTSLLARNVTDTATSLPVADKARLYVLVTYVLESLLFSYAKLNSLPTTHVMTELSRVRQYVAKIKAAAAPTTGPTQQLDTRAAGRFIKAALAGNEEYDREKREREEREKVKAAEKLAAIEAGMKEEREVGGRDTGGKKKLKGKRKDREEGEEKETKKKVKRSREEKEARREKRKEKRRETKAKSKSS